MSLGCAGVRLSLACEGGEGQPWVSRLVTVKLRNKIGNGNEDTIFRSENYKSLVVIPYQLTK